MAARRFWISGRVQGVWYRASTADKANEVGIQGYAENLADGRVEVLAVGDDAAIRKLETWLWIGPSAAHVTEVASEYLFEEPGVSGFKAR